MRATKSGSRFRYEGRLPRRHCRLLGALLFCGSGWAVAALPQNPTPAADLEAVLRSAASHYNAGDFIQAEHELAPIAPQFPRNFAVNELAGLVYGALGQDQKANLFLSRAAEDSPENAAAHVNLGVNWVHLGKNTLAAQELKKAIQLHPDDPAANYTLGELYAHAGKPDAALPYLATARRLDPSNYAAGYDLAVAYDETGRFDEASKQIQSLLQERDTAELHNLLGSVKEGQHQFIDAAREYQLAAHMDPSERNIFDWGVEMLQHWSFQPSSEIFSEGLKRYPNSVQLEIGLGASFFCIGQTREAMQALVHACDLAPSNPLPYSFLARAFEASNEGSEDVTARLARYAQIAPQDAHAHYYYALALWKRGLGKNDLGAPEAELKRAVALDPKFGEAYLQLGILYADQGRRQSALQEYEKAVQVEPSSDKAHYRLGQACAQAGDDACARKEMAAYHRLYQAQASQVDERTRKIMFFLHAIKTPPGTESVSDKGTGGNRD